MLELPVWTEFQLGLFLSNFGERLLRYNDH